MNRCTAADGQVATATACWSARSLRRHPRCATEAISRRIASIQGDTAAAASGIARISEVVSVINDHQGAIAAAVEEQTSTTAEMSRSVTEAATGSSEIAATIVSLATTAGDTSAGVAESQQATRELARMSEQLRELVSEFTI